MTYLTAAALMLSGFTLGMLFTDIVFQRPQHRRTLDLFKLIDGALDGWKDAILLLGKMREAYEVERKHRIRLQKHLARIIYEKTPKNRG